MKKIDIIKKMYGVVSFCFLLAVCLTLASCKDGPVFNDPNPSGVTAPVIQSIVPESGVPKDTVTITGTGFNTVADNNFVSFTNDIGTVISASSTELKVVLPAIVNMSVKVKATVKGSLYWSPSVDFQFNDTTTVVPPDTTNPEERPAK